MATKRLMAKFKVGDRVGYIDRSSKSWAGCVICSSGTGTISKVDLDKMFPIRYHVNAKGTNVVFNENQLVKMV